MSSSDGVPLLNAAQATFPNGFWWIKDRQNSNSWQYVSNIGGTQRVTKSPGATGSYNGSYPSYSAPSGDSIAYCWKYDSSDPTINGFEMKTNVGNGSTTISHNLGKAPDFIMAFAGRMDLPFAIYHSAVAGERNTWSADLFYAGEGWWGSNSDFTSTTFGVQANNSYTNPTGYTNLYFLWTAVEGYSKFGSYTGNGSADGSFVYLGFKPAFILLKSSTNAFDWQIYDSTRSPNNPATLTLRPNQTASEVTSGNDLDILSNGFKARDNGSINNNSGSTYVYMAFAESPFGGENQPPATAR
tara:strand:- start:39 stop:935 length:897 start_codon:yes stop_codon:yes gene_type:complete